MPRTRNATKEKLHQIIFKTNTQTGRYFDIALMVFIIASVLVVMLESVSEIQIQYYAVFNVLE